MWPTSTSRPDLQAPDSEQWHFAAEPRQTSMIFRVLVFSVLVAAAQPLSSTELQSRSDLDASNVTVLDSDDGRQVLQFLNGDVYTGQMDSDNQLSGKGSYIWRDGRTYRGQWLGGRRHGQGAQTWIDGDSYVGSWSHDQPDGWGAFYWNNGNMYEGAVVNGTSHGQALKFRWGDGAVFSCVKLSSCFEHGLMVKANGTFVPSKKTLRDSRLQVTNDLDRPFWIMSSSDGGSDGTVYFTNGDRFVGGLLPGGTPSGQGSYFWKNGDRYEGAFKDGLKHGHGSFLRSGQLTRYEGDFQLDIIHGNGLMVYPEGHVYQGQFRNGTRSGYGNLTRRNGDVYVGQEWDDDIGRGSVIYADGSLYEGGWLGDERHGNGTFIHPSGSRYSGQYVAGLRQGYGVYEWPDGARYEGHFDRDHKNGFGVYVFANGDRYEGSFVDDRFHGNGTYTWANGAVYVGQHHMDSRSGLGTIHYQDGKTYSGIWSDGQLVEEVSTPKPTEATSASAAQSSSTLATDETDDNVTPQDRLSQPRRHPQRRRRRKMKEAPKKWEAGNV